MFDVIAIRESLDKASDELLRALRSCVDCHETEGSFALLRHDEYGERCCGTSNGSRLK
jgi:hypothetical protein